MAIADLRVTQGTDGVWLARDFGCSGDVAPTVSSGRTFAVLLRDLRRLFPGGFRVRGDVEWEEGKANGGEAMQEVQVEIEERDGRFVATCHTGLRREVLSDSNRFELFRRLCERFPEGWRSGNMSGGKNEAGVYFDEVQPMPSAEQAEFLRERAKRDANKATIIIETESTPGSAPTQKPRHALYDFFATSAHTYGSSWRGDAVEVSKPAVAKAPAVKPNIGDICGDLWCRCRGERVEALDLLELMFSQGFKYGDPSLILVEAVDGDERAICYDSTGERIDPPHERYVDTIHVPNFNPRWSYGTAAVVVVVDLDDERGQPSIGAW